MNILKVIKNKKDPDFLEREISRLESELEELEIGSDEYNVNFTNLSILYEERDKHKDKKVNVLPWITGIGSLVLSAAGIIMTWNTAKMAYTSEEEMKVANGKVWNIKSDYNKYSKPQKIETK